MKISDFSHGRNNNFNLIRIVAALAVLATHSFSVAIGSGDAEPLRETLGLTMGSMAVDVFFLTSGFLVTASLLNRQSALEFVWARALRIFPALFVMVVLTTFVLGPYFSSLPLSSYLSARDTYVYFAKCSTLVSGVTFSLPGVFDANPFRGQVNASLWTMPYELRLYAMLAIIWFALRLAKPARQDIFRAIVVFLAFSSGMYALVGYFRMDHPNSFALTNNFSRLFFMFFCGAAYYVLRRRIAVSHRVFLLFLALLLLSSVNRDLFYIVYLLVIAYLLFYLAYVPAGPVRLYNRLGDYSYGIYIYAFPIQQSVAALLPGVSVSRMMLISAGVTIPLAILSWHLLERRMLDLKGHTVILTRRMMGLDLGKTAIEEE